MQPQNINFLRNCLLFCLRARMHLLLSITCFLEDMH
jgi:hypothetical protein